MAPRDGEGVFVVAPLDGGADDVGESVFVVALRDGGVDNVGESVCAAASNDGSADDVGESVFVVAPPKGGADDVGESRFAAASHHGSTEDIGKGACDASLRARSSQCDSAGEQDNANDQHHYAERHHRRHATPIHTSFDMSQVLCDATTVMCMLCTSPELCVGLAVVGIAYVHHVLATCRSVRSAPVPRSFQ